MQTGLLTWFDGVHRVLPWRCIDATTHEGHDSEAWAAKSPAQLGQQVFAYRVWVSEVMLQQTQVATVIAFFEKWVARWPTVEALAKATEDEVRAQWAGLGYYRRCEPVRAVVCGNTQLFRGPSRPVTRARLRRAGFLLKGAKHVAGELGGKLPSSPAALAKIPGIGPYTSAAIASIAFGTSAAAVDGNVIRVMSRLFTIPGNPKQKGFNSAVADAAEHVLCGRRPGDWNQAVMELGATVCKPTNPDCASCPVAASCSARRAAAAGGAAVTVFPGKTAAPAKKLATAVACVVTLRPHTPCGGAKPAGRKVGRLLLVKRPATGLLAGMWEVPTGELASDAPPGTIFSADERKAAAVAAVDSLRLPAGVHSAVRAAAEDAYECGSLTHQFTHITLTAHVLRCDVMLDKEAITALDSACVAEEGAKLVDWGGVKEAGGSTLTAKVVRAASASVLGAFTADTKRK